ncbi:MAG: imidazole glycerol phosphate synthase subunit HisH [Verrucomicrobia bacterium]|nr:imidazole glycerol phosphate synthase subunit HisH [Verrucomicrobiota bacterium]
MSCVIVNFGLGNLGSLQHKLRRAGIEAGISSRPDEIERARLLFLPGVGHFAMGMKNLRDYGLIPVLNKKVLEDKTPVMGICLGMQLMTKWSEEGDVAGLGWIPAVTRRFRFEGDAAGLKIPHIGWQPLQARRAGPLLDGVAPQQLFYFVHSYHVCCERQEDVLTTTHYGYDFVSAVSCGNILGTQFHPEKSHRRGMQLILNFVRNSPP